MTSHSAHAGPPLERPAPQMPDAGLGTVVLAIAFPLFSLLLHLPLSLYLANDGEFTLRLEDIELLLLPGWVAAVACGVALVLWLPPRLRGRLVALAFAFGLLLWVQGNLLVWQYGVLDGRDIEWGQHWHNGLVDTPLWLIVLGAAILAPAPFVKVARPAAAILIVVQLASLLMSVVNAAPAADAESEVSYALDDAPKYSFSPERNVIVVVLDTFQSDVFDEIITAEPEYAQHFDGFTYFPNAVAASNYTELAVPALLTGRLFDNSRPREEFMREAFVEHGLTAQLLRSGFVVDVYPWSEYAGIPLDKAVASNLVQRSPREDSRTFTEKKIGEALRLIDLAIFRSVPHFVKPHVFFSHQRGLATQAVKLLVPQRVKNIASTHDEYEIVAFMSDAPPTLPLDRGSPTFKFYHFKGPHVPLTVDDDLRFTGQPLPFSRHAYRLQAKANLLYLGKLFDELKEAGVYDDTLILVLGDHGNGDTSEMYIDAEGAPEQLPGTERPFPSDKARGIPLVLIKRIGATGPVEVSSAPVSLLDVPATVLAELGLDADGRGPSMFGLVPGEPRVRHFGAFEVGPSSSAFVDDITLYRIEGDSWRNESWSVDKILSPTAD